MYKTSAKTITADEFNCGEAECLWSMQGVGLFVRQENRKYTLHVVSLGNSGYAHMPIGINQLAVYEVGALSLNRTAKCLKTLAQLVVDMRAAGWEFSDSMYNSTGLDITARHADTGMKISKNSLPVFFPSTVSASFIKAFNFKLKRALKASLTSRQLKPSRVDKLRQRMIEEKPSFMHLALRMYPETDTQTLEMIAGQAQSLAQDGRSDMVSSIRAAYAQINEFPLLQAKNQ